MFLRGGREDSASEEEEDVRQKFGEQTDCERWFGHIHAMQTALEPASGVERVETYALQPHGSREGLARQEDHSNRKGGGVLSWGIGIQGRLGSGDWVDRFEPCRALDELNGMILQVSAGDYHSLALCCNGTVVGFGSNGRCQLGDGTKVHRSRAQMVADLDEGFVKVAAGGLHSLALHAEGFVLAWGDNTTGQVGQSISPFEDEAYVRRHGWPIQVRPLSHEHPRTCCAYAGRV
jgi:hypothetical protein